MSVIYSDLDLSLAFSEGHNDAWNGKQPTSRSGLTAL